MSKGLLFWIIFILSAIFGLYWGYSSGGWAFGGSFVVFVLVGLLGWGTYGPPVRG